MGRILQGLSGWCALARSHGTVNGKQDRQRLLIVDDRCDQFHSQIGAAQKHNRKF